MSGALAPGHDGAGTAEGTDDDAEDHADSEDDEADGTALPVSLLVSAVYAFPSAQKMYIPAAFIAADIWIRAIGPMDQFQINTLFSAFLCSMA